MEDKYIEWMIENWTPEQIEQREKWQNE